MKGCKDILSSGGGLERFEVRGANEELRRWRGGGGLLTSPFAPRTSNLATVTNRSNVLFLLDSGAGLERCEVRGAIEELRRWHGGRSSYFSIRTSNFEPRNGDAQIERPLWLDSGAGLERFEVRGAIEELKRCHGGRSSYLFIRTWNFEPRNGDAQIVPSSPLLLERPLRRLLRVLPRRPPEIAQHRRACGEARAGKVDAVRRRRCHQREGAVAIEAVERLHERV